MANALAVIQSRDILLYEKTYASSNAMPANTVAWGTSWTGYTGLGYTDGGVEFRASLDFADVTVDQELDALYQVPTGRDLGLSTSLAEITVGNLNLATGMGTTSTVAAGSGTKGNDDLAISSTIAQTFQTVGLDVKNNSDGEAFRILLYKAFPTGSVTMPFRPDAKAAIAYNARAYPDTSTSPSRIALIRDVIPALP
jgi:hypothetical protein